MLCFMSLVTLSIARLPRPPHSPAPPLPSLRPLPSLSFSTSSDFLYFLCLLLPPLLFSILLCRPPPSLPELPGPNNKTHRGVREDNAAVVLGRRMSLVFCF